MRRVSHNTTFPNRKDIVFVRINTQKNDIQHLKDWTSAKTEFQVCEDFSFDKKFLLIEDALFQYLLEMIKNKIKATSSISSAPLNMGIFLINAS